MPIDALSSVFLKPVLNWMSDESGDPMGSKPRRGIIPVMITKTIPSFHFASWNPLMNFLPFIVSVLIAGVTICSPVSAELTTYTQNFERMTTADSDDDTGNPNDIAADGWTGFAANWLGEPADRTQNDKAPLFSYGTFPAPNGGPGFSGIADNASQDGQGTGPQGARHLNIYNDYNEVKAHGSNKFWLDAIVFRDNPVAVGDSGKTWDFKFDYKANAAKGGTLSPGGKSKTFAFVKVLKSSDNSYGTMAAFEFETTSASKSDWASHTIRIPIRKEFEGELLQFGFRSEAQNGEPSGVLYDNISFRKAVEEPTPGKK
ncbi:hypothetical protein [Rubripirellula reticaptiva]|uniref:Uncharacterized protein n=1 Tax=Rubripirellula reticaptiva TaxID=2528013 RepID=A0A5C6F6S2_9BACT|nr:hypothetical protein [Rubripirellula reticaptiva]TWU55786.1 hypothetical protein Poly59_20880 [Rubripirellula reticaptiva]